MAIQNFPAALQPIIQLGFLQRDFQEALHSVLGYRQICDRETIATGIGETVTKTRRGLKAPVTTPLQPNLNTNFDNGLVPAGWGVEQFTLTLNMYGDTIDLNMVTSRVGIVELFLQNAKVNGVQAAQSLDRLARTALFAAYLGGNTRVRTTLGSAGTAVAVDDIRGFQMVPVNGVQVPLSASNTLAVTVGQSVYTLIGAAADGGNNTTAPGGGISGTLTFSSAVSTADGTALNIVSAVTSATIIRPSGRTTATGLTAADTLTMATLLNGVAQLRNNAVPGVNGSDMYNCYLDPTSSRQLFADNDFRQLFQGVGLDTTFRTGRLESPFLGLRMIPTTEAYVQAHPTIPGAVIRRPIIVGQGALIEGDFAGMAAQDVKPADSIIEMVDNVCMVTREPLDRLQQIIAQSWYWIGGFVAPSDITATNATIPTASNAAYKRAVIVEHIG